MCIMLLLDQIRHRGFEGLIIYFRGQEASILKQLTVTIAKDHFYVNRS